MGGIGETALYVTVWVALGLFVIGEIGARAMWRHGVALPWAWYALAAGAALLATHIVLALVVHHQGSHAAAVAATAEQTRAVYGVAWGGGVYVNYAFMALWLAEVIWWRVAPDRYVARAWIWTFGVRATWLVMLTNAAIVFAAPSRRPAGATLVAALLWAWTVPSRRGRLEPARRASRTTTPSRPAG